MITGGFELAGTLFVAMNVRQLHRDKQVRGVHWAATAFFTAWGAWNLYYYLSLQQLYSWAAGFAVFAVNSVWLGQILYYNWKERNESGR